MESNSVEWKEECLNRHKSEVKKLNQMSYRQAIVYCQKVEAERGRIAALEIWKSSKHYKG